MFLVPKHTGGLWPIPNLKQYNHYMCIPTFNLHNIRHIQQFIQHHDYALYIALKDAYLHIAIVNNHCHFFMICLQKIPYQWMVLPFGLTIVSRVFTSLTKPILFFANARVLYCYLFR